MAMTDSTDAADNANADPAELGRFGGLANRWWDPDGDNRALHQINPLRLDYLERRAGIRGKACLDVGCGGGLVTEGLAARGASRVVGIDLADKMLAVARLHAQEAGIDDIDYRHCSAEALAGAMPATFQLVTCLEMLEHVPDPAGVVGALARLVAPGGDVVLSTLNRTPKAFLLAIVGGEYLLRLLPAGTHRYERFIRPSELADWGRAHGLSLVDLTGIEYRPLQREFRLGDKVDVNYLAHFRKRDTA